MKNASPVQQAVLSYQEPPSVDWISEQLEGVAFYQEALEKFRGEPQSERALITLGLEQILEKLPQLVLADHDELPTIVAGDLKIQGDLQVQNTLLVLGDLVVQGTIPDNAPYSYLGLAGDLQCKAMVSSSEVTVFGHAQIGYWQGVGNNHSFVVGRDMSCDILFQGEHDIRVVGTRNARVDAHMDMPLTEQLEMLSEESPLFRVGMETDAYNGRHETSAFIDEYVRKASRS